MSGSPRVSLIVVSRGRPADLARVLGSLRYLDYPEFEVIVVSDTDPKRLEPAVFGAERIKYRAFDRANISAARNLGIDMAAGEIIAFCDDDAIPEPTWLSHLVAGFADPKVAAAGGYVRGRNGISYQWRGNRFDRHGDQTPLDPPPASLVALAGDADLGIKTEGANCAFRADILRALGGFDENYHYYLDETDLNYRLGLAGWRTALAPLAEVHHRYAASDKRDRRRAPRDLFQIGASKAYFCKRYAADEDLHAVLNRFRAAQRRRLVAFMLAGAIEPFDVPRLLASLDAGFREGLAREPAENGLGQEPATEFRPFPAGLAGGACLGLVCRWWRWRRYRGLVVALAARGYSVTVFRLSVSAMFHHMRYRSAGYWLQTGGIFGRSERKSAILRAGGLIVTAERELERLRPVRPIARLSGRRELEALLKS